MNLGIIPARLDSKRFPKKIIHPLNGKSIIQHVYDNAKQSQYLDQLIIAIDSEETKSHVDSSSETILTSRPNKTICLLMSEIELGISGNSQKANSWISRSNLGEPEKSWICKEYGSIQDNWASININGLFDTLEWTWPKNNFNKNSKEISNAIPDIIGTR